jgi:heat shock protein HtpX
MGTMKTTLLLAAMTGLFLFVGELIGGQSGMLMALGLAAVMNVVAYFWSDKIVLSSYGARPVTREEAEDLHTIVERLAAKAWIPMPRLYVIPDPALNAFATGRSPAHAAVAATEGILRAMNREELEGVLAHELSHVLNRDTLISTVAATLAGAISTLARMAYFVPMGGGRDDEGRGGNALAGLLMLILAPIAAFLIQMAVSRSREYARRRLGSGTRRLPERAGERPPQAAVGLGARPAPRCRAGDRASLHREPALGPIADGPLQHTSAPRRPDRAAPGDEPLASCRAHGVEAEPTTRRTASTMAGLERPISLPSASASSIDLPRLVAMTAHTAPTRLAEAQWSRTGAAASSSRTFETRPTSSRLNVSAVTGTQT